MAYGLVIQDRVQASNVDALNRTAKAGVAIENGMVFSLTGKETGAGETEMWTVAQPSAGAGLQHLWMAYSPELVDTNDQYRGLDPDPRNFIHKIGDPIDAFKPQIGDVITLTADALTGSADAYAVATASDYQLNWGAGAVSGLSLKLLATTYISIGLGSIGTQRVTAYQFEVVAVA